MLVVVEPARSCHSYYRNPRIVLVTIARIELRYLAYVARTHAFTIHRIYVLYVDTKVIHARDE